VRIHLAGEHALEFQGFDFARQRVHVGSNRPCGAFVVLGGGQLQQFVGAAEAVCQAADAGDDLVKLCAFLAELLGPLGVVPDIGVFQFAADFFETFALRLVVKDTPVTT
jgi:hypothetical protein